MQMNCFSCYEIKRNNLNNVKRD